MKIKKLVKLNILLTEYQNGISIYDSDKNHISIVIASIRSKINKYYWRSNHKNMLKDISNMPTQGL